jgi:hypothetical protein
MDHNVYCGISIHYNELVLNYVRMKKSLHRTGYSSGNTLDYTIDSKILLLHILHITQYDIIRSKTVLNLVPTFQTFAVC